MSVKDNFSSQSKGYARYRPEYPGELFDFILRHVKEKNRALDVGTGNGQVASQLASIFKHVDATDISEKQISQAVVKANIHYTVAPAEKLPFENMCFDLVTVGQAVHWFNLEAFYDEVKRVLKPGGALALFGYNLPQISNEIDSLVYDFYENILGPFWDPERKIVDQNYEHLHFPFHKIPNPGFVITYQWSRGHFCGYLGTWSGLQHYIKKNGHDPLPELEKKIGQLWPDNDFKTVKFPVFLLLTDHVI